MRSWHRFDLVDSSYALGLMAQSTPAWREVYVEILDQLIERHTGWWSASGWLTQFGADPDRKNYPDFYRLLIPPDLWGDYDVPGWTANGIEPPPSPRTACSSTRESSGWRARSVPLREHKNMALLTKWGRPRSEAIRPAIRH